MALGNYETIQFFSPTLLIHCSAMSLEISRSPKITGNNLWAWLNYIPQTTRRLKGAKIGQHKEQNFLEAPNYQRVFDSCTKQENL